MPEITRRNYYQKRKGALTLERHSFIQHWKELAEYIRPRRGRFFTTDRNKGDKRHSSIINSHATKAHQVATSGMLAGTMSPTRPWFSLKTYNHELMDRHDVKEWLFNVERLIREIFNSSNFYGQSSVLLSELLLFGTGAMAHVDDFDNVARFYTHTAGSYMISQNDKFIIDTIFREFEWTVLQLIDKFGLKNVSREVKDLYDKGDYDQWIRVCHIIEPNINFKSDSAFSINSAFKSVYFEPGTDPGNDRQFNILSESGFEEFPVYVPRWGVTGEDIYGTDCPAMTALGDIKSLQIEEKRKAQAIDKMVNPPLSGPASIRGVPVNSLPGGLTIYDGGITDQELKPIYQVQPQIQHLAEDIERIERRIDQAFFNDLFMAISTMEGIQPRNQLDLMQRNEERLLQLGPVLERLQSDFLDPLIDRTFKQCIRADILPPPPPDLEGEELRIQYISTLAMAQRAVATQNIDRLAMFVSSLGEAGFVGAMEKFDADQAVDEYAQAIGSPPSLVVPDDILEERRAIKQQQQQAQEALASAEQASNVAKNASQAKLDDDSLLSEAVN